MINEIKQAFKTMKTYKVFGLDNIPIKAWKALEKMASHKKIGPFISLNLDAWKEDAYIWEILALKST